MSDDGTIGNDQGQRQGAAPWTSELESRFSDPETRAQVDAYMRERVQPRMTQLEQTAAEARDAQALYDAFREDPSGTYLAVTNQLYGEDYANQVMSALSGEQGQEAQQQAEQQVQDAANQATREAAQQPALSDEDRAALDDYKNTKAAEQYASSIKAALDDAQMPPELRAHADKHIHAFVASAQGDISAGIARYRDAMNGVTMPTTTEEQTAQATAPTVMDGTGGTAAAPPTTEKLSWDDAFKSLEEDVKQANRPTPPPVGVA